MGKNLQITNDIEKYISDNSLNLSPIQKEIISYNKSLGEIKKMQISESQCHFLHLLIKTCNIKKILEIGTFTGLSTVSMLQALPDDGELIALDKNKKTSDVAFNYIKKANQENKIKLIVKPALESIKILKNLTSGFSSPERGFYHGRLHRPGFCFAGSGLECDLQVPLFAETFPVRSILNLGFQK